MILLATTACTRRADIQGAITSREPGPAESGQPVLAKNSGIIALETARNMLGVAYRYGGSDPRGFDCSGLVQYSYMQAGVRLPRRSEDIFRYSQLINPAEMQPGDLVFFRISSNKVSHVGIYAGNGAFIHSPSSGKGVSYAQLNNSYWRQRLVAAGRI